MKTRTDAGTILRAWFERDGGPRYIGRTYQEWREGLEAEVREWMQADARAQGRDPNYGEHFNPGPWRAEKASASSNNNSDWVVWNSTGQSVASHLREAEAKLLVAAYDVRHELTSGEYVDE